MAVFIRADCLGFSEFSLIDFHLLSICCISRAMSCVRNNKMSIATVEFRIHQEKQMCQPMALVCSNKILEINETFMKTGSAKSPIKSFTAVDRAKGRHHTTHITFYTKMGEKPCQHCLPV